MPPRSLNFSKDVCPRCGIHFLCEPQLCDGHHTRANRGRWYQHVRIILSPSLTPFLIHSALCLFQCIRHTFQLNSPCKYFRWITAQGDLLALDEQDDPLHADRGTIPLQDYLSMLTTLPPPTLPSPQSTPHSSSATPSRPLSTSTKGGLTPCPKAGCRGHAAQDCTHKLCVKCCGELRNRTDQTCKSRRHRTKGTTTPMADVSPQIVATLEGQPQHTTYARNLSAPYFRIIEQRQHLATLADSSDRETTKALREVDKTVCVEIWEAVRLSPCAPMFLLICFYLFARFCPGRSDSREANDSPCTPASIFQPCQGS